MSVLQHWLVLLMRILVFSFLVFAFARPYIPAEAGSRNPDAKLSIYIDNSFSMGAENQGGVLLDQAITEAVQLLSNYRETDAFHILTNDAAPEAQRFMNKSEAIDFIEGLRISPYRLSIDEVMQMQSSMWTHKEEAKVYWISDFQSSMLEFGSDQNMETFPEINALKLLNQESENLYIDSVYFANPLMRKGMNEALKVRVVNSGKKSISDLPLVLRLNGSQRAINQISLEPGGTKWVELNFQNRESGWVQGKVEIEDYPIQFDNQWFISYFVPDAYRVLEISENPSSYIKALFGSEQGFSLDHRKSSEIEFDRLGIYDLIIWHGNQSFSSGFAGSLKSYLELGGNLVIFPPNEPGLINEAMAVFGFNALAKADTGRVKINKIEYQHPLYQPVFEKESENFQAPIAQRWYSLSISGGLAVLKNEFGGDFAVWKELNQGNMLFMASALSDDWSNFQRHALFVPTLFNMAILQNQQSKPGYEMGSEEAILIKDSQTKNESPVRLLKGNIEFIPNQIPGQGNLRIFLQRALPEPGGFELRKGDEKLGLISLNYDRKESDLKFPNESELKDILDDQGLNLAYLASESGSKSGTRLAKAEGPKEYAWYCLGFALLFLLLESLLLKRFKA